MTDTNLWSVEQIKTAPIQGQKPGTSGLRKKVTVFKEPHYLANFVQSIFNALPVTERDSLVLGGDGRYFNAEAIQLIIRMAVANGYKKIFVARDGLLSTPAASHLIRHFKTNGGIILSASHNPAGPNADFGIKYNNDSGAPAPESLTQKIYQCTTTIEHYLSLETPDLSLAETGLKQINQCEIIIVDPIALYADAMACCFDFAALKQGFANGSLSIKFDAMHAITGPYAQEIFENRLGAPAGTVINAIPLTDFGGGHPDPNLVHAKELVALMNDPAAPALGAASDGDGDRNMILGAGVFISPSDSLAIIAEHHRLIPQFAKGLSGVARSMPTSQALDRVAAALELPCFETPTGWKFFGNLLDSDRIGLCGEESFGTGANHIREKDGIWAVLCWLTLQEQLQQPAGEILQTHWQRFGRSIYCRHDYEAIPADQADAIMAQLEQKLPTLQNSSTALGDIIQADNFSYRDCIDNSLTEKQGIRLIFADGSRIVYRLSGTGTDAATLRVYLERVSNNEEAFDTALNTAEFNQPLAKIAVELAQIIDITGRTEPSIIT